jgi:NitT/TauT family transport system substrate-binding protein
VIRFVRRPTPLLTAAFACAALAGGLGAQDLPTVRVITPPIDAGAQAFFAREMGFYKKAGLNVEVATANSGAAVAAAVAGGAADLGQSNVVTNASAHERGLPFVFIAAASLFDSRQHQNAVVVTPNSPIRTVQDLRGKTIAVSGLKNITEIGVDAWLDANGIAPSSIKAVEMPFATMAEAVASGRIDAADMTFPELSDALAKKQVRVVAYPLEALGKEWLLSGWFTTAAWAKAHPELVRAYVRAMTETADWANRNHDLSAKILERVTGIPVNPTSPRVPYARVLDPQAMQPVIDASAKYGALKATFPAADLVYH